jgi:hypothetical protein
MSINGVDLNDLSQNQITFQLSIKHERGIQDIELDLLGRVRPILRLNCQRGHPLRPNSFRGEAFDYLRNNYFDARNFFNRKPARQNSFIRNNPGGAFSGPIWRDHTFFFLSYEGLRQHLAPSSTAMSGVPHSGRRLRPARRRGLTRVCEN